MKTLNTYFFTLILFCISIAANAYTVSDGYFFNNYIPFSGSPAINAVAANNNTVYSVSRTYNNGYPVGVISVGTLQPDGSYVFSNYLPNNNFNITALAVDSQRNIYATANNNSNGGAPYLLVGTLQVNGSYQFNVTQLSYIYSGIALSVAVDPQGLIYIGMQSQQGTTPYALIIGKLVNNQFTQTSTYSSTQVGNSISSIYVDAVQNIYLIGGSGAMIGRLKNEQYVFTPINTGGYSFNTIFTDAAGDVYLAGSTGLGIVPAGGSLTLYTTQNGLGSNTVYSVYVDANNTVYAATANGVSIGKAVNGVYSFNNYGNGLGSATVSGGIAVNATGTIYAATQNGLSIGSLQAFTFTNYVTGLSDPVVLAIKAGSDGTVYAGTLNGLTIATPDGGYNFANYSTADGLDSNLILSLFVSSDQQTLYVGTQNGLNVGTRLGSGIYSFQDCSQGLNNKTITGITVDNSYIYVATLQGIARSLLPGTGGNCAFTYYQGNLGSLQVEGITEDSKGILYAATNNGVSIGTFANGFTNFTAGLPSPQTISVTVDANGTVYVATPKGLAIATSTNNYSFTPYTNNFVSTISHGVTVDTNGNVYVATEGGLIYGEFVSTGVYNFVNSTYGLGSNLLYGVDIDAAGNVYVGTANGFAVGVKQ